MKFSKLRLIERQVEEEGKQWKRKRMEELIKQLAPQEGEVFPPRAEEIDQEACDDAKVSDAERTD
jgi:hypothetical protein